MKRGRLGDLWIGRVCLEGLWLVFERWMGVWVVQRGCGTPALSLSPLFTLPSVSRLSQRVPQIPVSQTLQRQGLVQAARGVVGGRGCGGVERVMGRSVEVVDLLVMRCINGSTIGGGGFVVGREHDGLLLVLLQGNEWAAGFGARHFDPPWLAGFSSQH